LSWCLPYLLQQQAQRTPDAIALVSPGRAPLTYGRLLQHTAETVQTRSVKGVGSHDRVALVLPNGPEMAVAFLAVAARTTCVPLNPAYSAHEYERYLADVGVKALIVRAGMDSPARDVAQTHGVRIIELSPIHEAEAGLFTLQGEPQTHARVHG
jgi:acyl-CoA synthetase (AMP-forming)/AMP-acid ligase II